MADKEPVSFWEESQGINEIPAFDIKDWEEIAPKIDFIFKDEKLRRHWKRASEKRCARPEVRLGYNMSCAINFALKLRKSRKDRRHWEDLVGYTAKDLVERLKKTLPKGVTWEEFIENRADYHIDHIIPQSVFNYETSEDIDFKRCWALSNLQILPALENIHKMTKIDKPFQPSLLLRPRAEGSAP